MFSVDTGSLHVHNIVGAPLALLTALFHKTDDSWKCCCGIGETSSSPRLNGLLFDKICAVPFYAVRGRETLLLASSPCFNS
jgi:hypothetical protein